MTIFLSVFLLIIFCVSHEKIKIFLFAWLFVVLSCVDLILRIGVAKKITKIVMWVLA